jgi:cation-transporting ATPase 13A1
VDHPLSSYISWKGYKDETDITTAKKTFGLNKLKIAPPDFWVLFSERATAPFFVFQVFCVGLWCLDEYWYYSLFTLAMLVLFETLLVQQQIRNLSEIQKMGAVPYITWVYRGGRWLRLSTAELLPGDLISFGRHSDDLLVPCDVLLLSGTCIVDESMLTGESVPQMKEPLSSRSTSSDDILNISTDGRLHVVYGGTKVVQHSSVKASPLSPIKQPPDQGCLGYVLRTGFNTSQGKLLRTILFGVKRVTANNLETFMFILFLLVFAIIASAYVWTKGTENPDRNRYKLFLECTLILTSVVPPELPIELSLAVNNSLLSLTKIGVYCTEPFRIPFAGKVDICCFDKTGTLTSDNLIVQGIAGIKDSPLLVSPISSPLSTQCVLASCHSLSLLDNELVGDPLEKAAIQSIGWKLSRNDTVSSSRGQKCSLSILHRFHFSSSLKRMSVVVHMTTPTDSYISCVKGAPEVIKTMLREIPRDYDDVYSQLSYNGARVLALGHRDIGRLSMKEAGLLKRHEVERDLDFDGFIAISCPLKKHTKECIDELKGSSHHVRIMENATSALGNFRSINKAGNACL